MLSLTDELRKFEKMTYENELDGIITVQDNFSNGSVTIRDLVKQNHVIINEFKRMKNVFINYTKLNQKIYDKIVEHELTFGSSVLKLGNMTNFFQNTIEGTLDKMKIIYEDTIQQNKVSEKMLEKNLKPLAEQMTMKVDIGTFNMAMKALNGSSEPGEHDSMESAREEYLQRKVEEQLSKDRPKQERNVPSPTVPELIIPKREQKSKKISEEELNMIKQEVLEQINAVDQAHQEKFTEIETKMEENRKDAVTLHEDTYRTVSSKIIEAENKAFLESVKIKQFAQTISDTLEIKTHSKVWEHHKNGIMDDVKIRFGHVNEQILSVQKRCSQMGSSLKKSLKSINDELTEKIQTNLKTLQESIQQLSKKQAKHNSNLNSRIDQSNQHHKQLKQSTDKKIGETEKSINSQRQRTTTQILDLRDNIDKLVLTLQGSVLKLVVKRFQQNINDLVNQMKQLRSMQKQTAKRVSIAFEHINDIKQVTGKKANFTDIVNLFEKKASKEQVGLLKDMLSTAQMHPRKNLSTPTTTRGGDSCQLRRTSHYRQASHLGSAMTRAKSKRSSYRNVFTLDPRLPEFQSSNEF